MICPNCSHHHLFKIGNCLYCGMVQPSIKAINKIIPDYKNKWKPSIFLLPVVILSLAANIFSFWIFFLSIPVNDFLTTIITIAFLVFLVIIPMILIFIGTKESHLHNIFSEKSVT